MSKRALITGITGQAGSHLADLLLEKGYTVFGLERRKSTPSRENTKHLEGKIEFIQGDLTDQNSLLRALKISKPHEVYNLAAQSFVGESWNTPEQTSDVTGLGVLRMLEAIKEHDKHIRFCQASSSEMYGKLLDPVANEETKFHPRSPYGVAKVFGYWITRNYRESYHMYACNAICFNYEGPRRGHEFVTRKITDGVAKIYLGLEKTIRLGNLDAFRDWGAAEDTVRAMWGMMQLGRADDYVIATNTVHSVRQFLTEAFLAINIEDWKPYVVFDERFMRPAEVDYLRGDYSKAKRDFGWEPKIGFREMVRKMVENDIALLS